MKKILLFVFLFSPVLIYSQAIVKGSGIVYTNGVPTHAVNLNTDAEVAIDTTSGLWYERSRDGLGWLAAGFRIQKITGSSAPTGAPADKESEVVINDVDSLYRWRASAWRHINKIVTYTAGTGINITSGNVIENTGDLSDANEGVLGVAAGAATTSVITSNTSGAAGVTIGVSGNLSIAESTSSNGGSITITGTEVDGSVTNEGTLGVGAGGASSSTIISNTSGATGVTVNVSGILSISESTSSNGGSITITGTEVDGSVTNELQTLANTSDATSHTVTLSNSGGSVQLVEGANVTLTTSGTGSAGIVTIAATSGGGADLSYSGASSPVTLASSTGTDVTFTEGGIVTITSSGSNMTISATEVDGSVTNELQTISNTSDATSHTVTLSNSGGSIQLVEGSNITLTTSGTGSAGIVTIASTGGGAGTDLAYSGTTSPVTLTSSTGTDVTFTEGGIVTITASGSNMTISATEVDGSVSNELQTYAHSGTTSYTNTLSNGGGSFTLQAGGIVSISNSSGTVTIGATEVDGSVTNELQTLANTSNATSHTVTLSNSGGSVQLVEGANITLTTSGTGSDGIVTIAATSGGGTDLSYSGATSPVTLVSNTGTDVTFTEGGIVTITSSGSNMTISATEVDGSVTNELQTYAHSGTTSYTNTLSNGGGSFTLQASGIVSISNSSGTVTIGATEVDGSVTNELQTISNTSDATSHTVTLSNSGGSVQFVEGANITLTTSGTGSAGIVTIAATSGGGTDLSYSGASSPVTLASSSGTDVTFTEGGIVTITSSGSNMTISATEVDGSVTNELQTYAHSGTTSYTNTLSDGGGSFTLQSSGIVSISNTSGTVTIGATEVDGSVTNELQTISNTSDATSHTVTLSNSGGSVQLVEGSNITLTTTGTGSAGIVTIAATGAGNTDLAFTGTSSPVTLNSSTGTDVTFTQGGIVTLSASGTNITITGTEVDGSVSNEGTLGVGAGGASSSTIISNTSGATGVTVNVAGILSISETTSSNGGSITITGTEVDGSVSNELQTYAHSGTTSYTNTLSNGGGSFTLQSSGIVSISNTSGTVTISATEVDGSVTNELQTISNTSDATSHTVTLSNSGGSIQLVEGSNITLTTSGTGSAGIVTIASTGGGTSTFLGLTDSPSSYTGQGGKLVAVNSGETALEFIPTGTPTTLPGVRLLLSNDETAGTEVTNSTAESSAIKTYNLAANSYSKIYIEAIVTGRLDPDASSKVDFTFRIKEAGSTVATFAPRQISATTAGVDGGGRFVSTISTIINGGQGSTTALTITGQMSTPAATTTGLNVLAFRVYGIRDVSLVGLGAGTDLSYSGTSSPVTLASSSGTDVTFTQGGIVTLSASGTNITISATEVDGSVSNEGTLGVGAGGASSSTIISNTSGATGVTVNVSGILSISESTSSNGGSITITGTEVDGSVSNEGSLSVSAGGSNDSQIASNTSGSTNVTISGGTGIQVTESGSTITVSATATTLNAQTGTTYTLVLSDAGKFVTMSNAAANTLTVPPNSSVAFPTGTVINIAQGGAGQTTIAPGAGVTINSADSKTKLRVQYSSSSILKTATDTWLLVGDITN